MEISKSVQPAENPSRWQIAPVLDEVKRIPRLSRRNFLKALAGTSAAAWLGVRPLSAHAQEGSGGRNSELAPAPESWEVFQNARAIHKLATAINEEPKKLWNFFQNLKRHSQRSPNLPQAASGFLENISTKDAVGLILNVDGSFQFATKTPFPAAELEQRIGSYDKVPRLQRKVELRCGGKKALDPQDLLERLQVLFAVIKENDSRVNLRQPRLSDSTDRYARYPLPDVGSASLANSDGPVLEYGLIATNHFQGEKKAEQGKYFAGKTVISIPFSMTLGKKVFDQLTDYVKNFQGEGVWQGWAELPEERFFGQIVVEYPGAPNERGEWQPTAAFLSDAEVDGKKVTIDYNFEHYLLRYIFEFVMGEVLPGGVNMAPTTSA